MIRALHVYCEFSPRASGVARHMDGLAHALADHDVACTIFSHARPETLPHRNYAVRQGGMAALAQAVRECDVVHAHGSRTLISTWAQMMAAVYGKACVFTPHCYYQGGGRLYRIAKWSWDRLVEDFRLRKADKVILLHEGWRQAMAELGLAPCDSLVIPNCIDGQALRNRLGAISPATLSGSPALLSIGRLHAVKRLDLAIAALTRPMLARAHLHIVGQGPADAELKDVARRLRVQDRVVFHGWRDDDDSLAMMRGCDAMILASDQEGLPTVMLEALFAGTPIATSAIDGNLAISRATGWLHDFPPGDADGLARCVAGLPPVPPQMREKVEKTFTWQGRAAEMAAVYSQAIAARRRT